MKEKIESFINAVRTYSPDFEITNENISDGLVKINHPSFRSTLTFIYSITSFSEMDLLIPLQNYRHIPVIVRKDIGRTLNDIWLAFNEADK